MTKVIIIDDDALVRQLLARILEASGVAVVGEGADGDEAAELVRRLAPDVVLMDLRMARMSGIEATRAVLALPNPPGVVALTSFDTRAAVLDAVEAGVAGFLAKDSAPEEIVLAIHQVARGEGALSPRAARVVLEQMRGSPESSGAHRAARKLASLSGREREAAFAVAEGLSNPQIAQRMHVSEATVKTHLVGAMTKVDAANRVQLAVLVATAQSGNVPGERSSATGSNG